MNRITKLASSCRVATPHQPVINSECVYTFHTPYTTDKGIVVNLITFVGTIEELALKNESEEEALFVRICKKRVAKSDDGGGDGYDAMDTSTGTSATKLGVGVEGGFQSDLDKYDTISTHSIVLMNKSSGIVVELPYNEDTKNDFPMLVSQSADSVINHAGLAVHQDLKAWELDEEPKPVSKYAEGLPFVDNGVKVSSNPADWKVCLMKYESSL